MCNGCGQSGRAQRLTLHGWRGRQAGAALKITVASSGGVVVKLTCYTHI